MNWLSKKKNNNYFVNLSISLLLNLTISFGLDPQKVILSKDLTEMSLVPLTPSQKQHFSGEMVTWINVTLRFTQNWADAASALVFGGFWWLFFR